jgi:mono/diheme cytochrome c family protein
MKIGTRVIKIGLSKLSKLLLIKMRVIEATDRQRDQRLTTDLRRWIAAGFTAWLVLAALAGCDVERRKSDAELGLNPQQAAGRKIYDNYCDRCHRPYSTKGKKGPGLKGVFQHQYLPQTGLPANDDRVTDIIRNGRPDMPGYSQVLSPQDMQDLLAYMHTL